MSTWLTVSYSGVSTLLKTLSGETYGLQVGPESRFNYQGRSDPSIPIARSLTSSLAHTGISWSSMHSRFRGEIIYQAETDIHFPQLTVGQTLFFAARARTPQNRLPGISREDYARCLRDVVMAIFGISHTGQYFILRVLAPRS